MKKTFTILSASLIILIACKANAQDKDTKTYAKSYLSIIGGISSPTGDFANATYSNYQSGFAKRGVTAGLDGAVYIYKNLAIGATLTFQDQGELNATDVQNLSNGYNSSFFKDETVITAVNRYNNINLMGGPQYSFLFKNFTLDLRAEAGIIKSLSTPSFIMYFDNSTDATTAIEQHSSQSRVFAYGGSVGLRYGLGDHWDVGLKTNYIKSDGFDISYANDPGTTGRYSTKQPVSELQTTLGITLKF